MMSGVVRWCWLWLAACASCALWGGALAVVGGEPAAAPEPDAAVVFLQRHGLSARLEGNNHDKQGYYSFLGIRYAEPPVGQRRFQRPVRRYLSGELNVKSPCQPCPQLDSRRPGQVIGHEDCLCLSVYAPKMPGNEEGSPVIIFIHGGNYRSGSSNAYGGQHLTQKDTILVTLQYRLGSLGFISTGQKDASGNAGLFDIQAAYNWVNDYIKFFGGDPSRVVVMGQGSGGSAASLIALSPEGRSARGVVALSGAPLSPNTVRNDPAEHARQMANYTNCPLTSAENLVACLKKLPMDKIVKADSRILMEFIDTTRFLEEISGRSGAGARVEGADDQRGLPPLVAETPAKSLSEKKQRCPLLTGVTSAETSRAVHGKYANFLTDKLKMINDFIKKELIGGLRNVVQGVEGLVPLKIGQIGIPLADYYQALLQNSMTPADGLLQIAEATSDALFNFPAYQSIQAWSSAAPAFLYSFEHIGNLSRGSHFLPGVALTDDTSEMEELTGTAKGPGHGDELAYVFEPLDDNGKPLGEEVSSTDARVRNAFVGLIAKFAHTSETIEKKNNSTLLSFLPFSKENDQFLKIGEEITLSKNFRFCQMGLWGNMAERVTSVLCKNLFEDLLKVPNIPIKELVSVPSSVPVLSKLPVLAGNQVPKPSVNKPNNTPKTTKKPLLPMNPFSSIRL